MQYRPKSAFIYKKSHMMIITDKLLLLQNDFSNVIFFSARISPLNTPAEILYTRYCLSSNS